MTTDHIIIPACPSWCELDPGHGYDSIETATGRLFRSHGSAGVDVRLGDGCGHATVSLLAEEACDDDGTVERSPARIWLDLPPHVPGLTGPEARRLAAALLDVADAWDAASVSRDTVGEETPGSIGACRRGEHARCLDADSACPCDCHRGDRR